MTDCDCESIYSEKTSLDCCKGHSSFDLQYHVCIMMPITITSTATSSVVRRPRIQTLVNLSIYDYYYAGAENEGPNLIRTYWGVTHYFHFIKNKHCEILVSCSDKESNCMQAHWTSCKLIELHESLGNCMHDQGTACKLMSLHACSCNSMQATVCKLL